MAIPHILYLFRSVLYRKPGEIQPIIQRAPNTTVRGEQFDEPTIEMVWKKATKDWSFHFYRKDRCGSTMARHEYGKKTQYGWEIDHIIPVSEGGTDDLDNLQPLHWENNASKGELHPDLFFAMKE